MGATLHHILTASVLSFIYLWISSNRSLEWLDLSFLLPPIVWGYRSRLLGLLDVIYARATLCQSSNFNQGVGTKDFEQFVATLALNESPSPISLRVGKVETNKDASFVDVTFPSPATLPDYAQDAHAQVFFDTINLFSHVSQIILPPVPPSESLDHDSLTRILAGKKVVIMFPFTGDFGYGYRRKGALKLLSSNGIVSILITAPFWGKRRHPSRSIEDTRMDRLDNIPIQILGFVGEMHALTDWLALECHVEAIALSGISLGGAAATITGMLAKHDVAIVSSVGSHSPSPVYETGALSLTVDWHAIGGIDELVRRLGLFSLDGFVPIASKIDRTKVYTHVYARHDYYIPTHSSLAQYEAVSKVVGKENVRRVPMNGGHVMAILKPGLYFKEITNAFEMLRLAKARKNY